MSQEQQVVHNASKTVVNIQTPLAISVPQENIPVSIITDTRINIQSLFDTYALQAIHADKTQKQEQQRKLVNTLTSDTGNMSQQFLTYLLLSMEIGDFKFKTVQQKNQFYMNNYIKYYSVLYDSLIDKALSWLSDVKATDKYIIKLKSQLESIFMSISRTSTRYTH